MNVNGKRKQRAVTKLTETEIARFRANYLRSMQLFANPEISEIGKLLTKDSRYARLLLGHPRMNTLKASNILSTYLGNVENLGYVLGKNNEITILSVKNTATSAKDVECFALAYINKKDKKFALLTGNDINFKMVREFCGYNVCLCIGGSQEFNFCNDFSYQDRLPNNDQTVPFITKNEEDEENSHRGIIPVREVFVNFPRYVRTAHGSYSCVETVKYILSCLRDTYEDFEFLYSDLVVFDGFNLVPTSLAVDSFFSFLSSNDDTYLTQIANMAGESMAYDFSDGMSSEEYDRDGNLWQKRNTRVVNMNEFSKTNKKSPIAEKNTEKETTSNLIYQWLYGQNAETKTTNKSSSDDEAEISEQIIYKPKSMEFIGNKSGKPISSDRLQKVSKQSAKKFVDNSGNRAPSISSTKSFVKEVDEGKPLDFQRWIEAKMISSDDLLENQGNLMKAMFLINKPAPAKVISFYATSNSTRTATTDANRALAKLVQKGLVTSDNLGNYKLSNLGNELPLNKQDPTSLLSRNDIKGFEGPFPAFVLGKYRNA